MDCRRSFLLALLFVLLPFAAFAQEATLTGRVERSNSNDQLQLYVMGTVGEKRIDLANDGTFSVGVDLLERSRAVLFWAGRSEVDWTCTFWLQPDSTLQLTLSPHKSRGEFAPKATFAGANANLSTYTNLYYQSFERENLLDSAHMASLPDFAACQKYIDRVLQPIGEALMFLDSDDLADGEEMPEGDDDDTLRYDNDDDNDNDTLRDDNDDDSDDVPDRLEMARVELDFRQAKAEFTYACLQERAGHPMEADAAFRARLDEFDYSDVGQAEAIALMTQWRIVAHPQQYAPLTGEAAQLRCLAQYVSDEDVRNEVAERIMQQFFFRVQMGEADPASPAYRDLYAELRRVSTSDTYEEFIATQLDIMDHPDLYGDDEEAPAAEEEEE